MLFLLMTAETGDELSDDLKERNKILDKDLRKLARGKSQALDEVYELTKGAVYGFILSILKNEEDSEDVMQDTYLKVCLNADQYRTQGKPMAWIMTIARNLALMKLRSQKRYADIPDYEWDAIADDNAEFGSEDRMVLKAALTNLNSEESQIVLLHAVSGLKHREIAEMLDMPLATVLSKYNRSIKKLQKMFEA
ncbi:RNA polymerase sigma-70 factor, ECF subfamily [Lachnospiraceae bacterium XPB1003]|nr:RNA polymerase sigma-70 factor, ECF subfamily [Lachnospiraceae bacterium XPB1003]